MANDNSKSVTFAVIIGISLIFSSLVVANTFYKVKALDSSLSVTGSAKKVVVSDMGKWTGSFSRTVAQADIKAGYQQMAKDLVAVKKFFTVNGVEDKDLTISPIFMNEQYNYNSGTNEPPKYILQQNVEFRSADTKKVTELANKTQDLIQSDVLYSAYAPEYYYTKLPEIRVALLGEAIKDARQRADKIAESGGSKVSKLTQAAVGVTQLLPVNSTEVSDYGAYDTSSVDKEVTITVRASFGLN
jgi:hypothetical protein